MNKMTIEQLEQEIQAMKEQLFIDNTRLSQLEKELNLLKQAQFSPAQPIPIQTVQMNQGTIYPQQMPMNTVPQNTMRQPLPPIQPRQAIPPKKKKDFEQVVGKSWMGIMASVLVFISLILFAITLLPYMTDMIKLGIIYVVSSAFLGVGLTLYHKSNKLFYMILSACGMGSLYLSFLLSNVHFHVMNDIVLYICFLGWGIGIAYLSRKNMPAFNIIGNIGLVIAVLLGTVKCGTTDDMTKFCVLLVYFFLSSVLFGFFNRKYYLANTISNLMSLFILIIGYIAIAQASPILFSILVVMLLIQFVYVTYEKKGSYFCSNLILKCFFFLMCFVYLHGNDINRIHYHGIKLYPYIFSALIYLPSVFSLLFVEKITSSVETKHRSVNYHMITLFDIAAILLVFLVQKIPLIGYLVLIPIVFGTLGYFKQKQTFTIATLVSLFLALFLTKDFLGGLLIFLCTCAFEFLFFHTEHKFGQVLRGINSILLRISLAETIYYIVDGMNLDEMYFYPILFLLVAIVDKIYAYLLSHQRRDSFIIYCTYASNSICALLTCYVLAKTENSIIYYSTCILGWIFIMNNVLRFLKSNKTLTQLYAMCKITVYVFVIANTLAIGSIWFSIVLFVLAIIWILVGFRLNGKPVRLYGLISALFSICKLILVDIHYDSLPLRAVGFFVCGLLAFSIYFIYNRFEKKI